MIGAFDWPPDRTATYCASDTVVRLCHWPTVASFAHVLFLFRSVAFFAVRSSDCVSEGFFSFPTSFSFHLIRPRRSWMGTSATVSLRFSQLQWFTACSNFVRACSFPPIIHLVRYFEDSISSVDDVSRVVIGPFSQSLIGTRKLAC